MKNMKADIAKSVRGELRVNGKTLTYKLTPGVHEVDPDVFAALAAAGIAKRPAKKATKRKETE